MSSPVEAVSFLSSVYTVGRWLAGSKSSTEIDAKSWDPEPISVIAMIALLKFCPDGTKVRFLSNGITLDLPSLLQGVKRAYKQNVDNEGASRDDLGKLKAVIRKAVHLFPPEILPKDTDLNTIGITEILLNNNPSYNSLTKLYLFAIDGLKNLTKTYKHNVADLATSSDDCDNEKETDSTLTNLHVCYQLIRKGLLGKKMKRVPEGLVKREVWQDHHLKTIHDHFKNIPGCGSSSTQFEEQFNEIKTFIKARRREYKPKMIETGDSDDELGVLPPPPPGKDE